MFHKAEGVSLTVRELPLPPQHRKSKKEELEEQAGTVKAKAKRFGHWFGHKAGEAKDVAADNLGKASVRGPAQP